MEEDNDYTQSEEGGQSRSRCLGESGISTKIELKNAYIEREKILIHQYSELSQLKKQLWQQKEKEFNSQALADPFLIEYLKELAEEGETLEMIKQQQQSRQEVSDQDWEKRDTLLKKLEEINLSQKPPIEFFKAMNDIHIGYKCLVEDLNNQIYKCYLKRLEIDESSNEFIKKIKSIRTDIKAIRDKNEKLATEIDNLKSH